MLPAAAWAALLSGFALGLSLIVAVGPQNLYVLRQGVCRQGVGLVVGICAGSDVVLISGGVLGGAVLFGPSPALLGVVRAAGAIFLLAYSALAARRAIRPPPVPGPAGTATSAVGIAAATLAFTWLNPAVWLDTVVVVGSAANGDPRGHLLVGLGAALASVVWFAGLGFGARVLAPVFARPAAWRLLDAVTSVLLLGVAARLLLAGG